MSFGPSSGGGGGLGEVFSSLGGSSGATTASSGWFSGITSWFGGLGQSATNLGTSIKAAASPYTTQIQAVMAALSVIGMMRIAPDLSVSIGGKPAMHQLSFMGGVKAVLKIPGQIISGVVGVGADVLSRAKTFVNKVGEGVGLLAVDHGNNNSSSFVAARSGSVQNSTKINPAGDALSYSLEILRRVGSANTSTVFWSTTTATTSVGAAWWTVQQNFLSTATNSYFDVLANTLLFTDGLSGVGGNTGVMTVEQIIQANPTGEEVSTSSNYGLITPTVPAFASVLLYPSYINSATTSIYNLALAGNTPTTTVGDLTTLTIIANASITYLQQQLNSDASNQTKYLAQSSHVGNIMEAANTHNSIAAVAPAELLALYESTIHPNVLQHVQDLSTIMNLQSSNSATVLSTILKIGAEGSVI